MVTVLFGVNTKQKQSFHTISPGKTLFLDSGLELYLAHLPVTSLISIQSQSNFWLGSGMEGPHPALTLLFQENPAS